MEEVPMSCKAKGYIASGSFNNLAEINVAVIEMWSGLLMQVPASSLLLKDKLLNYWEMQKDLYR